MLTVGFTSFLTLARLTAVSRGAESFGFGNFVRKGVYHEKIIAKRLCRRGSLLDE